MLIEMQIVIDSCRVRTAGRLASEEKKIGSEPENFSCDTGGAAA